MKKAIGWIALPLLLASCGGERAASGSPYRIQIYDIGYEAQIDKETGQVTFTIPSVQIELHSAAGAPDVREIKYVGTLLDGDGQPAALKNSQIVPLQGTLFAGGKGGYFCSNTPTNLCTGLSPDVTFVDTGPVQWPQNRYIKALVPGEWASAQWNARSGGSVAPWSVNMEFTAYEANGKIASWTQNYQFVRPAGQK